jgi:hypothetical protein
MNGVIHDRAGTMGHETTSRQGIAAGKLKPDTVYS